MALLGRSPHALRAQFYARCCRPFLFSKVFKKVVFFCFVFVILARVHLAGAVRFFWRCWGAPGRLPDAMFDALRAAKTASLCLPIYEWKVLYNQMGSFLLSICSIFTFQSATLSWGVGPSPPGPASAQMIMYESGLVYGQMGLPFQFGQNAFFVLIVCFVVSLSVQSKCFCKVFCICLKKHHSFCKLFTLRASRRGHWRLGGLDGWRQRGEQRLRDEPEAKVSSISFERDMS